MDKEFFLEKMIEILDLEEEPDMSSKLTDFELWDSLAVVTFLSTANKITKKRIDPSQVQEAKTLNDLFSIVKKG